MDPKPTYDELLALVGELRTALKVAHQRLEHLSNEVARLKRYGATAPNDEGQGLLAFADAAARAPSAPPAGTGNPEAAPEGHGRRRPPPNLVRKRIEHHPSEAERVCACCGQAKARIGEDLSYTYEYVPAVFQVLEHARIKYACAKCRNGVVLGPAPEQVIDRGMAEAGLLAIDLVNKFNWHQPTYRLEDIFEHHGLRISRSTQNGWQAGCASLLAPIVACMKLETLKSPKIHADDTTLPVLEKGRGKTKTARLWAYLGHGDYGHAVYDYTTSRSRDGPAHFLRDYKGYLQADAYGGYDGLYVGGEIIEVACWAHVRRKFEDAAKTDPRALEMLVFIRALYDVEHRGKSLAPTTLQQLRQMSSVPVLARIKAWLDTRILDVPPRSPLGEAVRYCQVEGCLSWYGKIPGE